MADGRSSQTHIHATNLRSMSLRGKQKPMISGGDRCCGHCGWGANRCALESHRRVSAPPTLRLLETLQSRSNHGGDPRGPTLLGHCFNLLVRFWLDRRRTLPFTEHAPYLPLPRPQFCELWQPLESQLGKISGEKLAASSILVPLLLNGLILQQHYPNTIFALSAVSTIVATTVSYKVL